MDARTESTGTAPLSAALGRGLPALVQVPGFGARVQAAIVGRVLDRYLILRSTMDKGGPGLSSLSPRIGDDLIVRLFENGVAYGFTTDVLLTISHPEPLVFLRYPKAIEQVNVREHPRLACRFPCGVIDPSGRRTPALLLDISSVGCRIACKHPDKDQCEAGRAVTMELTLPDPEGLCKISGKLVRVQQQEQGITAGMVFDQSQASLFAVLSEYLCLDEAV